MDDNFCCTDSCSGAQCKDWGSYLTGTDKFSEKSTSIYPGTKQLAPGKLNEQFKNVEGDYDDVTF